MKFSGVFTALVTPFKEGKVDFASLEKLLQQQLKGGVSNFVVNGTTAESPTVREEESLELLRFVKEKAPNAKVVFGSGSNSTQKTIELSLKAQMCGADGLLLVVPYYNKPPQEGLYLHFQKIAQAVQLPQLLYNVPSRTISSLELGTIKRLAQEKNIVGIKEATGNLVFAKEIQQACPSEFCLLSGDDESCLAFKKQGGHGVISVASHLLPKQFTNWFSGVVDSEKERVFAEHLPLIQSLYISTNPIPTKAALHIMGIIAADEVRLPLVPLQKEQKKQLEEIIKKYAGSF